MLGLLIAIATIAILVIDAYNISRPRGKGPTTD